MAFRSLSRGPMLSLSEDIRILLKCFSGEGQPADTASNVVLQQVTLVGLKQESLHSFPRQIKHEIRKRLDRKVSGSDLLVDCPLKYTEIPKSGEQSLGNACDRVFGPIA